MFAPRNSSPVAIYGKEDVAAYEIKLKKVLGLTVCSNAALDCSPISGLLAYPAGCTIVLFNAKRQTQAYLVNTSRKAFTSVAFSRCGRYVATGECGMNPAIKVWELEAPNGNLEHCTGGNVVAEFVDHKYAVTCVAFSPTGKFLVSVGSQHDMIVNVFDWKSNLKMASNKISSKVSAVSFAEDGSYFVTVGNRHVKYWYLEGGRKYKDPVPLMGRSAILGDLRDNDFCAVACGKGACAESTYAITRQGHLVEFSSRRLLEKWVQCRTTNANCISVAGQFILVGCAEAIIRIFNASTLEYVTTLPRTHYLGVDVAQGIHINHIMTVPPQAKYPDCIAMAYDEQRLKVTCIYNDHSLYIWDMRDIKRVGKSHSFLYHSTCIWGVETVPYNMERELSHTLPEDSFVTCSSDDTIRVWGLEGCANNEIYRKNIYSKELLKVVYIDDDLNFIKDQEIVGDKNSATNNSNYDGRNGVRCIKISPELEHLASGDRSGNIRIYNLNNLKLITAIEAHESEVLCLEYSNDKIDRKLLASASRDRLIHVFDVAQDYKLLQTLDDHSSSITSIKFVGAGLNFQMISCGADKSIMFRTFQGNIFLRGTHTSGKTTLYDMEVDSNAKHILTACQDRNIRVYGTQNSKHTKTFKGSHSDEGSLIKLSLDPSGIYVATSCTDKTLAVYDYYSNECMARMYGHSELVTGLKFTNDCRHLISASGDGCVFIWQVPHDMIVTMQARLSQQRLRSGHAPISRSISQALIAPEGIIVESPTPDIVEDHKFAMSPNILQGEVPLTPGYKLSDVGQLPQWAKRKAGVSALAAEPESPSMNIPTATAAAANNSSSMTNLSSSPSQGGGLAPRPRNRWAQRGQIDADTLTDIRSNSESPLGSVSTTSGIVPAMHHPGFGNTQTSDYNSASSKDIMYNQTYLSEDSSIDSGMETRRELKFIGSNNTGTVPTISAPGAADTSRVTVSANLSVDRKQGLRFDTISNNDHDGDVEDISDGERTSSDHGMFYNNISPSTPTDFKVNAMNEEELRKSVRRQKFEKAGLTLSGNGSHTASTGTGTGTSDTEDEGSTPSAENADRSLASTLGGSSESIPQTSSSFLQAALPDGPGNLLERGSTNRRSISAKHNTENGKPGVSAPPTITKSYTSTKKEELLKVINEAKQKLENVGYRSLRGSHSISDLSLAGNLDGSRSGLSAANRYAKTGNPKNLNPMPVDDSSSIRRACSLSDLHMGNMGKGNKSNSSSQKTGAAHRNSSATRTASKRNSLQIKGSSTNLSANASMGVLNQSDSETEGNSRGRSGSNGQSRTNGPTASTRSYNSKNANANNNRRKGALQTSFNNAPPQDDSSSEETQGSSSTVKPIVPPRPRNLAFDHKNKIINSPNVVKTRGVFEAADFADLDSNGDPKSQVHNVINKLYTTTQTVLQLHANLRNCEDSLMLKELENAVIMTQNMLTNITQNKNDKNNQQPNHTYSSTEQANLENGDYMMMVNNCADLLNNFRMKHKPDDCENNS
ncbi:mitogen-activated protein kinase-binding protein 1 isoform X6 [Stomoxys calcitrans]|uniref:MABP1/WDR62 second WD40 domain-containing protein n=1 Tax=Stomoxys calcitrans TaxID=35570 RepID=A0A1I8QEB0_STOCA|nr:mitogen-activated protein kinase-binding protein 1 isoform X6 [Stomoxys calcitrans]